MADGGELQPLELHHELHRDAEEGADQQQFPLAAGEARPLHDREQAEAREEEAVQDVVADAEAA